MVYTTYVQCTMVTCEFDFSLCTFFYLSMQFFCILINRRNLKLLVWVHLQVRELVCRFYLKNAKLANCRTCSLKIINLIPSSDRFGFGYCSFMQEVHKHTCIQYVCNKSKFGIPQKKILYAFSVFESVHLYGFLFICARTHFQSISSRWSSRHIFDWTTPKKCTWIERVCLFLSNKY